MHLQIIVNFEDGSDRTIESDIANPSYLGSTVPVLLKDAGIEKYSSLQIIVIPDGCAPVVPLKVPAVDELGAWDRIGRYADQLDAGLHAVKIPGLDPKIHIEGTSGIMREVRDGLATIVRDETGVDPWETNPFRG